MAAKLKIGIMGPGGMAHKLAATIVQMDSAEVYAVASRDEGRAADFARQYGAAKSYGSYEALAADPEVELVYVASPHSHHLQHATLAMENGKGVLVEKSLTANAAQARQMVALAQKTGVFLCEAVWTRFLPIMGTIRELAQSGAIGEVVMVSASHGQNLRHIHRLTDPHQAGGALLDLGVYPIHLAFWLLGPDYTASRSAATLLENGVDGNNAIFLQYPGLRSAVLKSGLLNNMEMRWQVYGTTGMLEVEGVFLPTLVRVLDGDGNETARHEAPPFITGYEYEIQACVDALRTGRTACDEIPWAESLRVMELCDACRAEWGMRYPFEE